MPRKFSSPRLPAPSHSAAFAVLVSLIAVLVPSGWASAQEDEPEDLGPAARSAIAVPFVGVAEVWCTDRNPSTGTCRFHHGSPAIDIGLEVGVPIYAAGAGTVLQVEADCSASWCRGGAGLFVEIGHPDGTSSRYLHLSQVSVQADDEVVAGDVIGLAGNSGSASALSPHLHYDEHFPRGTRTPFGPMFACVDGDVVEYPAALGYASWNDVPFGTELVNDGFECLGGAKLRSPTPDVLRGPEVAAIRPPAASGVTDAEVEITDFGEDDQIVSTLTLPDDRLTWFDLVAESTYTVRQRVKTEGQWQEWSTAMMLTAEPESTEPTCRGLYESSMTGTERIDVLIGTDGDDSIWGRGGDDVICSGRGHDIVYGGDGNDWIHTGHGRDTIDGGSGRDRIVSGPGRDRIAGGDERDRIISGSGSDVIVGGRGGDIIVGNAGDDLLHGEAGRDRIRGGNGDDTIVGGGGHDQLQGNGGRNEIDGGSGTDICVGAEKSERCE